MAIVFVIMAAVASAMIVGVIGVATVDDAGISDNLEAVDAPRGELEAELADPGAELQAEQQRVNRERCELAPESCCHSWWTKGLQAFSASTESTVC